MSDTGKVVSNRRFLYDYDEADRRPLAAIAWSVEQDTEYYLTVDGDFEWSDGYNKPVGFYGYFSWRVDDYDGSNAKSDEGFEKHCKQIDAFIKDLEEYKAALLEAKKKLLEGLSDSNLDE